MVLDFMVKNKSKVREEIIKNELEERPKVVDCIRKF